MQLRFTQCRSELSTLVFVKTLGIFVTPDCEGTHGHIIPKSPPEPNGTDLPGEMCRHRNGSRLQRKKIPATRELGRMREVGGRSHLRKQAFVARFRALARPRLWRGGRVVECTALEMRHTRKGIGGSNPSLSAKV